MTAAPPRRTPQLFVPRATEDRLPWARIVGASSTGLCAGLLFAWVLRADASWFGVDDKNRGIQEDSASPDKTENSGENADGTGATRPSQASPADPRGAAHARIPPLKSTEEDRFVEFGRVAYLRCDGADPAPGPYPCPRDEALEQRVWEVLSFLPKCVVGPRGTGQAEIRLDMLDEQPPLVDLRPGDGLSVTAQTASMCVERPLSDLRARYSAARLVISFRFRVAAPSRDRTPQ